jgi:hypothetical protein
MLEAARHGKDTSQYWINGTTRIKLFNVLSYEVMSDRPLTEVVKANLSTIKSYYNIEANNIQKKIDKNKELIIDIQNNIKIGENLHLIGNPPNFELFHTVGIDELEKVLEWAEEAATVSGTDDVWSSAINILEKVTEDDIEYLKDCASTYCMYKYSYFIYVTKALREVKKVFDIYLSFYRNPDSFLSPKNKEIDKLSRELKNLRKKNEQVIRSLQSCEGTAYKVLVNSTNKAGQSIHNLWTITTKMNSKGNWKVTYLFDEKDLEEKSLREKIIDLSFVFDIDMK